jgi:YVTN family beta-propeller protein
MIWRFRLPIIYVVTGLVAATLVIGAQRPKVSPARTPGPTAGPTLLPNGWKIQPAGRQLALGNMPLAMLTSNNGRYLVVAMSGYLEPGLAVVDTGQMNVEERVTLEDAWFGVAATPDGHRLYASGADANVVREFGFADGRVTRGRTLGLPPVNGESFVGGLAVSRDDRALYAVRVFARSLSRIDLKSGVVTNTVSVPVEPYTCVLSPDGRTLFVSLWGGAAVVMLDANTLEEVGRVSVGEHPNAMVVSSDGTRLFVACANTNAVWAIDVAARKAVEQIGVSLYPDAPAGTTPNALALSPDGHTLLVANADNNDVAVVDISTAGSSRVRGFIPTGWYPTGVLFSRDGRQIFILTGKGLRSVANPNGPSPGRRRPDGQYTGNMLIGTIATLAAPDARALAAYTKTVYALTPYRDATRLAPAGAPPDSPIPAKVGQPSPIKHVFYIIRENRTYDQVLGDVAAGNGDPALTLFGAKVTPNAHALVHDFVLLDNFYVNAEVSYDGHQFSTAAYATDVVEKLYQTNYAGRGTPYLAEGISGPLRNAYGNLAAPSDGYIWDACERAGVSVRSYGEFVRRARGSADNPEGPRGETGEDEATVPGLKGRIDPDYPPFNLKVSDNHRIDIWLKEFQELEANGHLPGLSIIRLGNDHTSYTDPGALSPNALVADNDLALGRLVDAISHSRDWKDSAIFVVEDDAQSGPDHVDAHRSVALMISPFIRRGFVDHTLYTTTGILRTMELILGLPPMSQYDASATPAYAAFQATANLAPFTHLANQVPLDTRNPPDAYGSAASARMDLSEADRVPDLEGDEILWRAIKGAASRMPPPVHAAWLRVVKMDEDDQ